MKFLLAVLCLALCVLGKEDVEVEFESKKASSSCPGPFRWNKAAKRCQRLIKSGNTQFIKTKCCVDEIKKLEKLVDEKIITLKEEKKISKGVDQRMVGRWRRGDGSFIEVKQEGSKLKFIGEILRVARAVNTGDFESIATMNDDSNKASVKVTDDCDIDCTFREDFLEMTVAQTGSDADCGFGRGVYAGGEYKKVAASASDLLMVSEKVKTDAENELRKEIEAEEIRQEAAKQEEAEIEGAGIEVPPDMVYDTQEEEKDDVSTGGCMKKCYYRKYPDSPREQINCAKLHKYKGRRDCFKGKKKVDCSELKCKLVHEVQVEKEEVRCRRVCYYRPSPDSRFKRRIPCRHVDTKYVGDKKCAVNGVRTPCRKLTCNVD